jgi:hypothetical protein
MNERTMRERSSQSGRGNRNAIVYMTEMKHAEEITVQPLAELLGLSDGKLIYQLNPNVINEGLMERIKVYILPDIFIGKSSYR